MSRLESFRVPHTLVLLLAMMAAALVATWLLPQGSFATTTNEHDREVVQAGTFEIHDERVWLSPLSLLTVVPRALADAQEIIFFVFLIGGALAIVRTTGAIDAMLGRALELFGDRSHWLIIGGMVVFAVASGTFGMAEEYIPFVAILIALCAAMGMDAVAAVGIMVCGYGIGYGVAPLNPFTVMVAQEASGLVPGSGWELRVAIFLPFLLIGIHHVLRYARRVQADPMVSLVADQPAAQHEPGRDYPDMTWRHRLVLLTMLATLVVLVVGVTLWGWYLVELAALFFGMGVAAALIGRIAPSQSAKIFCDGAAAMTTTALLIGFARGIALMLEDGQVLHTVVHGLATPLTAMGAEISAVGMLFIQTVLNLFIPSGSGQALATMPIMAPIGDLVGVSRQVAVLAYQFGDGFANMIVPTNAILMAILGIAGIPFDRWLRFIVPLMGKLLVAGAATLVGAVLLGYQ
jgi:uncharacterized ion transporter superfamily protein YfcC